VSGEGPFFEEVRVGTVIKEFLFWYGVRLALELFPTVASVLDDGAGLGVDVEAASSAAKPVLKEDVLT